MLETERYQRVLELYPPDRLQNVTALVIGAGAIGRQVLIALAACGIPRLHIVDPDVVEEINIPTQAYDETDVGQSKVSAAGHHAQALNNDLIVVGHVKRFERGLFEDMQDTNRLVLFCCVDSISAREFIFRHSLAHVELFVDGRITGQTIRVLVDDCPKAERYLKTVFPQEEAFAGRCTNRTNLNTAMAAAALMMEGFAQWLAGEEVDGDVILNLRTKEISVCLLGAR